MDKTITKQLLEDYITQQDISIEKFLNIAVDITSKLLRYHEKNIIYKYISPKNIFVEEYYDLNNEKTTKVVFKSMDEAQRTDDIIFYTSPEQTGRVNLKPDFRSDLYSLGCLFYEIITGRILFYNKDVSKIIYDHISTLPVQPAKYNKNIPKVISSIILKLLNKNPEDRYLSGYSLLKDLKKGLNIIKSGENLKNFELDKNYGNRKFKISDKIFGRTNEVNQIYEYLRKPITDRAKVFLVYGESGIGKSSIVKEAGKLIKGEKGYFIEGKFNKDINKPFEVFNQAFTQFVKESLLEKEELLSKLRCNINGFLGSNCKVLINLMPIFNLILEKDTFGQEITIDEKNCHIVIFKLIQAILDTNRKLTIFIDDFQWADSTSIKLIMYLVNKIRSENFMLIIAYRGNELSSRANKAVKDIEINNGAEQIDVKPLGKSSIVKILDESFKFYEEEAEELSSVIFDKTAGYPFFIVQFLKFIYNKRCLYFNVRTGKWAFDIGKVININCTDNVVNYIMENVKCLHENTIKLMALAACIGNEFRLQFLAHISNRSYADTYIQLISAVNDKFLTIDTGYYNTIEFEDVCKGDVIYKFSHDKIRRALYDINSIEDKKKNHLLIGEHLIENNLYILEGVKHINFGVQYVEKKEKSVKFSKLNYEAGKIALSKAAYEDAYEFFEKAKEFLGGGDWKEQYKFTYDINYELLRIEYIRENTEAVEHIAEELLEHADSVYKKSKIYKLRVQYNIAINQEAKAEEYTEQFLKFVGINLKFDLNQEQFEVIKNNFKQKMDSVSIEHIYSLPQIKDETINAVLNILSVMYWIECKRRPLVYEAMLYKSIELSIQYGNSVDSCMSYWQYGKLLIKNHKLVDEGYKYGELAYKLAEQFNNRYNKSRIIYSFGAFLNYYKKPFVNCLEYINKSVKLFAEQGVTSDIGYVLVSQGIINGIIFKDLNKFYKYLKDTIKLLKSINFKSGIIIFVELLHYVEKLMEITNETDEKIWRNNKVMFEKENNFFIEYCYYSVLLKNQYMFEQYFEAVKTGRKIKQNKKVIQEKYQYLEICQYYCLSLSQIYFSVKVDEKEKYLKEFYEAKHDFEEWATLSLVNYEHKILFVQAEGFCMEGKRLEAIDAYDKAIKIAIENDCIQDAAIINEVASRFYFRIDKAKVGICYLKEALYYYKKLGAVLKIKNINEKLEKLYSEKPLFKQKDIVLSDNFRTNLYNEINKLDLNAVIDAYTAISIEINLEELLKKLIKILVKNTGAQEGYLLLKTEDKISIEIGYNAKKLEQVKILNSENYIGSEKLAESVVTYVAKTKENVILDNATNNNIFVNDSYIQTQKPASVLCVPIIYKNKLTGEIYLQNNITANVFDENKIKLVTLIGIQAAISIENALMYKKIKKINSGLQKDVQSSSKLLNEAIEHDQLKNEFFANLSHEFRTPLNVILSAQQMLDIIIGNHTVDENEKKIENYNNIMKQNCLRLLRMVNNLIDITKIDAGFFKVDLVNKDIIKIIEDIVLSVVPYVENRGLMITFDTNVEEKIMACDDDAIERIILNLISNAVKFSKANSKIFVDVIDKENNILIKVRDTGIGIPKEKLGIIFDRFIQVDKSLSRLREGSGIGLALTKSLVELLGGKITVESTYGEYSEFSINLPCKTVAISNDDIKYKEECANSVIERINIEFSDIYS